MRIMAIMQKIDHKLAEKQICNQKK